jgi:ABC-2 type transport system permease protein
MAMGLARERETGTLEQLQVTPIPSWLLMLGKILPFVAIGVVDLCLALVVGAWIFDVPLRGNLLVVLVATFAYLLSTLGSGLLIATMSRTQQQAYLGGFLFMLPAVLLSGVLTPISSMPAWLEPVTYLNPVRYFVEIMRGVLLRGGGFAELGPQLAALWVFGVFVLAFASAQFQRRTL